MSMQGPYAVPGARRSAGPEVVGSVYRALDPTTIVPGELAGDTRQAFVSRLPAETITGMLLRSNIATALSSAGMTADVSAMKDQLAIARRPGCFFTSLIIQSAPSMIPWMVPRSRPHSTILTSTISTSGATPSVAPATAPATAVPCALQIDGSAGNAV